MTNTRKFTRLNTLAVIIPLVVCGCAERNIIQVRPDYSGEAQFLPIEHTSSSYAVNTSQEIIQTEGLYYLWDHSSWFVSDDSQGPWERAKVVPHELFGVECTQLGPEGPQDGHNQLCAVPFHQANKAGKRPQTRNEQINDGSSGDLRIGAGQRDRCGDAMGTGDDEMQSTAGLSRLGSPSQQGR